MTKTSAKAPRSMSHLEVMLDDQLCLAGINPEDTEFFAIPGRRFRWEVVA